MRIPPRTTPTAIAAGRLRPARDVFGASLGGPSEPPVSVFATEVDRCAVLLDLKQLAFFVLDQLVDLVGVLVRGLLEVFFGTTDLVLAGLAVPADAV
jgi:hypothetical protein